MRIALFGYGKMGKTIEKIALQRGHEVVLRIDKERLDYNLTTVDVAIDFSTPTVAFDNINKCFEEGVPVVSGTTGWLENYEKATNNCKKKKGAFIYASNFSLGVNLFFELNKQFAKLMSGFETYHIEMEEIHHTQKIDAPSGTAITLAEDIIHLTNKESWSLNVTNKDNEIPIVAKRIENVPGTHQVTYISDVDQLEIKHTAENRDGFALGAIIAAEWLQDRKGVYTMKDVLGI